MLPTAEQIRSLTLQSITGTARNPAIDSAVLAADAVFSRWCRIVHTSDAAPTLDKDEVGASKTLFFDGPNPKDSREVRTRTGPISATPVVACDVNGDWTYTDSLVFGTDFAFDIQGRIFLHPLSTKTFTVGKRSIRVGLVVGVDTGATPELTWAYALQVAHWWRLGVVGTGVQAASQGGQTVTNQPPAGIPPEVQTILEPYRRIDYDTTGSRFG